MKAPEKIWVDDDWYTYTTKPRHQADKYILSDLVDELVGALEECLKIGGYQNAREMIQTALAKIKEET